jgi:hypothetical protein
MNFMNVFHECCSPPRKTLQYTRVGDREQPFEVLINTEGASHCAERDRKYLRDFSLLICVVTSR